MTTSHTMCDGVNTPLFNFTVNKHVCMRQSCNYRKYILINNLSTNLHAQLPQTQEIIEVWEINETDVSHLQPVNVTQH